MQQYALLVRFQALDDGIGMDLGAPLARPVQLRLDTGFRIEITAAWFEIAQGIVCHAKLRKALANGGAVPGFMRDPVLACQLQGGPGEVRAAMMGGRRRGGGHDQHPALLEQPDAPLRLQLAPEVLRTDRQRYIGRALAYGLAGDAGGAVAGAQVVGRRIAIDARDPDPTLRQLVERGRPHGAQAQDNDVMSRAGHLIPCSFSLIERRTLAGRAVQGQGRSQQWAVIVSIKCSRERSRTVEVHPAQGWY